jgi:serine/threonine protein kinase
MENKIEIGRNKNILKNLEILNGENADVNIFFKHEKAISRKHCEIFKQDSQWLVKDKKSTNGTFLNGKRIQESCQLQDGDKLSLGKETFIFIQIEDSEHTHLENFEVEETSFIKEEITKTRLYLEEEHLGTIELSSSTILNRGQYKILKQLGKNNHFTITYLAKEIRLDAYVVIKEYFPRTYANRSSDNQIIPTHQKNFNSGYEAFKEEARVIANIPNHSNIIGIKNFFEENDTIYHVMDYIKGDSLENYLIKNYPLNQKTMEMIIFPFLEGIKHIHKYNILHRNIKLSNVLMCKNGTPILIDFAISKEKSKQYSQNSKTSYTEEYKAIEQQRGNKEGEYTDIYAIGMMMYTLINGIVNINELPSSQQRLNALKAQKNAPLNFYHRKKFSKNFIKAIEKALEVRPKDRPQTIEEFSKLLNTKKRSLFAWLL